MKYYLFILFYFCISLMLGCLLATKIECDYNTNDEYPTIGTVYQCIIVENLYIKSPEDAVIIEVSGTHVMGYDNDDVLVIHAEEKEIEYFPKGLEFFFKNLQAFFMPRNKIRQISQADLIPYPNLIEFMLHENVIEIIEDDLFKYHRNMQVVWFDTNNIFHVGKNVFNYMNNITYLGFGSNQCVNENVFDDSLGSIMLIETLKSKCIDYEFEKFSENLQNLEIESEILTFETFQIWRKSLEGLENEFNNSKFSYLLSIQNRFEILNAISIDDFK